MEQKQGLNSRFSGSCWNRRTSRVSKQRWGHMFWDHLLKSLRRQSFVRVIIRMPWVRALLYDYWLKHGMATELWTSGRLTIFQGSGSCSISQGVTEYAGKGTAAFYWNTPWHPCLISHIGTWRHNTILQTWLMFSSAHNHDAMRTTF